jgi:hypothetical protein
MEWEQRFCPNPACAADYWQTRQAAENPELWRLVDRFGGGTYTVAAVDPVCPWWGTALHLSMAQAQPLGTILEAGRMLEFLRNVTQEYDVSGWSGSADPAGVAGRARPTDDLAHAAR